MSGLLLAYLLHDLSLVPLHYPAALPSLPFPALQYTARTALLHALLQYMRLHGPSDTHASFFLSIAAVL